MARRGRCAGGCSSGRPPLASQFELAIGAAVGCHRGRSASALGPALRQSIRRPGARPAGARSRRGRDRPHAGKVAGGGARHCLLGVGDGMRRGQRGGCGAGARGEPAAAGRQAAGPGRVDRLPGGRRALVAVLRSYVDGRSRSAGRGRLADLLNGVSSPVALGGDRRRRPWPRRSSLPFHTAISGRQPRGDPPLGRGDGARAGGRSSLVQRPHGMAAGPRPRLGGTREGDPRGVEPIDEGLLRHPAGPQLTRGEGRGHHDRGRATFRPRRATRT